jgi:hypothetical protein
MQEERETVSRDEAAHEVRLAARRIALLHMAFGRAATETLGEEKGHRLIVKAIRIYGSLIGAETRAAVMREGLEPVPENFGVGASRSLPKYGVHAGSEVVSDETGRTRYRAYGCVMADVWEEYGAQDIGRLYCLVDPAKYMAFNPAYTLAHAKAKPSGDPYCEFCVRETTPREQLAFASDESDWTSADRCDVARGKPADERT